MHTSARLAAEDFKYWQWRENERRSLAFAEFCANYHELDRIGVVSSKLEDGVLNLGRTLLALTTAFYDRHRARGGDFFDYPQHFAFVGADSVSQYPEDADPWGPWRWLDVWPDFKWISAAPTASEMLGAVFEHQMNRIFWPDNLLPTVDEKRLPDYAYRMLQTRLKTVYHYSPNGLLHQAIPRIEVGGSPALETLREESIDRLPEVVTQTKDRAVSEVDSLQIVPVAEFIAAMQS
ncbi:MAG: hypothetical protein AAF702_07625 [Chloroflexota bacterium]